MKNKLLLPVVLLFLSHTSFSQKMDTKAVVKFWEITEVLKKDHELTDALWASYYSLPGVENYIVNNRSEENIKAHREYLELFFKPSLSDSLEQMVNDEKYKNDDIFQNLKYLKENETELREYTKEITSPSYLSSALEVTKQYLPKSNKSNISEDLNIYIQPVTYDAAVQNNSMYFGLSIVHDFDKFQKGTVAAHELHHLLRNNRKVENTLSRRDSASLWVIDKINNEGSADLIDKVVMMENEDDIFLGALFNQILLQNIEPVIAKLDQAFIKNHSNDEDFITKADLNETLKYFSGHIPGFYMAAIIKRNGYEKQLIQGCENPFNIFYLYNKAAENDSEMPLMYSAKAIKYLKELEKKAYGTSSKS